MDKQQAQTIIKNTFESPFDKSGFTGFIKNLLNRIDDAPFIYQGNYIPDAYKQYIKTLERIGKFSDGENRIDILVITLQKETSLERARTMQRNFIAWYLNGSRGGKMKEAALAAFVSPDKEDWRFSLVKMDYKFEQTKSGRMKVKEEFTPARRWSFLVGENEKSHTAQSRLVKILANDEHDPTLKEIEKAFDIETVTKEFFLKYRELFLHTKEELDRVVKKDPKIKADFETKGVDTVNFAKKLLGQIIFLYFLQKKGWFGVPLGKNWGDGDKKFLRNLFGRAKKEEKNYFNDYLEPLFYEALRNNRSHEDHYFSMFNCKIPFLNGGLFDPINNYDWKETDIKLPNELFSNDVKTKEGDKGTGILDIFDRYNFTVKEDEPLEKEVAIDPELLGKSYEKFNAIRPDNYAEFKKALKSGKKGEENKFNKKFGVYYTPREIVHYMCQQSLINYLDSTINTYKKSIGSKPVAVQKKLFGPQAPVQLTFTSDSFKPIISKKDIETLIQIGEQVSENEAIFLEKEQKIKKGEQKTTSIKLKLSDNIRKNAKLIDDKLAEITVCDPAVGSGAFPVGMMSEIVKARNVLSVFLNDKNRKTYNFKRRCIEHSLYGVDIDPGAVEIAKLRLWLSLVVDEDDIKNIKPLPNLDYRIMQGNSLISEFMGINFDTDAKKNEGVPVQTSFVKEKTDELIEQFQHKKDEFLNESNVSRKTKLKEEVDELLVEIFETKLRTQKADYFNRLKNIENKYSVLRNEKQRNELINQDKEKLNKESGFDLEFAEKQLKEFTSGRMIKPFFLWNLYFSEVFHQKCCGFDVVIANPPYETSRSKGIEEDSKTYFKRNYETAEDKYDYYVFFIEKSSNIVRKNGTICLITPSTFLLKPLSKKIRKYLLSKYEILTIDEFKGLVFESVVPTAITIFKNKTADEAHRIQAAYNINSIDSFLNGSFSESFTKQSIFCKEPNYYINIYADEWFFSFFEKLSGQEKMVKLGKLAEIYNGIQTGNDKKYVSYKKKSNRWDKVLVGRDIQRYYKKWGGKYVCYEPSRLHSNTRKNIFKTKEKIIIRQTSDRLTGAYDDEEYFTIASTFVIKQFQQSISYKALLGVLNSTLFLYLYRNLNNEKGRVLPQIKKKHIFDLPIKVGFIQEPLIKSVDKILTITKADDYLGNPKKQARVKALEREIDQLVYKVYGMIPEEIKIVEGENENTD